MIKILIVDDELVSRMKLQKIMDSFGECKLAENGEDALKIALSENPPNMLLLDIMMPGMDGFEVCRRLKADPKTKDIPVIFLTAHTEIESITRGFQLGAVDYITKPFHEAEVKARVKTHLLLKAFQIEIQSKNEQLESVANKLSKYVSPDVYQSIFTGSKDVKIETETKFLTVFFSDIEGFTRKSESMEERELAQWLNRYLNAMAELALRFGGTLDKFVGDAVMIFFGDIKTAGIKEDAVKCLRMAMEMQGEAKKLGVDIRVGINSGKCTVGNFGSENRMSYTIIGKEVNVAARLENNCLPGQILIAESTHELIKEYIPCKLHGKISVKGIDRELNTFWVEMTERK